MGLKTILKVGWIPLAYIIAYCYSFVEWFIPYISIGFDKLTLAHIVLTLIYTVVGITFLFISICLFLWLLWVD